MIIYHSLQNNSRSNKAKVNCSCKCLRFLLSSPSHDILIFPMVLSIYLFKNNVLYLFLQKDKTFIHREEQVFTYFVVLYFVSMMLRIKIIGSIRVLFNFGLCGTEIASTKIYNNDNNYVKFPKNYRN